MAELGTQHSALVGEIWAQGRVEQWRCSRRLWRRDLPVNLVAVVADRLSVELDWDTDDAAA